MTEEAGLKMENPAAENSYADNAGAGNSYAENPGAADSGVGKTAVVTGGSGGIGFVVARELARRGMRVLLAGRHPGRTPAAVERINADAVNVPGGGPAVEPLLADLSSLGEIARLAGEIAGRAGRLELLVNNAGAIFLKRQQSVDGFELTFALNHLGYFALTHRLLPLLRESAPARVVNVASSSHWQAGEFPVEELPNPPRYRGFRAYARSKLGNVLFTYELARRLAGTGVTANAVHPGLVATRIMRNNGLVGRVGNWFIARRGISVEQGAAGPLYLAAAPEAASLNGQYFDRTQAAESSPESYNPETAARLWRLSQQLTGLGG